MCDKSFFSCCHRATTATATAAATSIAFAVLSLCVLPAYVSATNTGVVDAYETDKALIAAEVQQFKTDALLRIDNFLQHKLPEKARSQGEGLRAEALQQFDHCAQLATSKEEIWRFREWEIWRFRECAAKELGGTMKQLGLLVEQAYSGASTMATHAFWWKLLKFVGVF
ncbi:uncharacterized protein LOC105665276 [Ceratitis capitata]|uniref:uncharacterized protein LOC105665276 n=1 Tax=Ceratitis capitata TaxID=7213 RepID=UPI0006188B76|nr:uncharacterized protein LOC105665276 [Ceratitis capitata]